MDDCGTVREYAGVSDRPSRPRREYSRFPYNIKAAGNIGRGLAENCFSEKYYIELV